MLNSCLASVMAPSTRSPSASPPPVALVVADPAASAAPVDPADVIRGWARGLDCDGVSLVLLRDDETFTPNGPILWSTWGERWLRAYSAAGWFDVDPRVEVPMAHGRPCLWDGGTLVAEGRRARFLHEAARVGIRSGLAIPIRNRQGRAIVAFDSSTTGTTAARREAMLARLGEAIWVAETIHASRYVAQGARAPRADSPEATLSARERSCLALSARGFTSRDIATRLGIATRTVDFHIGNVLVKLAAANRHEAIAKAAARGLLAH